MSARTPALSDAVWTRGRTGYTTRWFLRGWIVGLFCGLYIAHLIYS
jgi:hypothetical protein